VILSRVARSFVVLLTGQAIAKGFGFASVILLARALGSGPFGIYAAAATAVSYGMVLTNLGSDNIGTREVSRNPESAGPLALRIAEMRLIAGCVASLFLLVLLSKMLVPFGASVALTLVLVAFCFRFDWALIGLGEPGRVAVAQVVRELGFCALVVGVVLRTPTLQTVATAFLIAEVVWSAVLFIFLTRKVTTRLENRGPRIGWLIRESAPVLLLSAMALTYNKIDGPLLVLMKGPQEAGVYSAAYAMFLAGITPGAVLGRAVLPELSAHRSVSSGQGVDESSFGRVLVYCVLCGIAITVALSLSSSRLLALVFGSTYGAGGAPLVILSLCIPLHYVSAVILQRLLVEGRGGRISFAGVCAAGANVGTNLLLIPRFGMVGAAIATVAAEIAMLIVTVTAFGGAWWPRPRESR